MDVSRADPRVVYGLHNGLQVSRDGGRTWRMQGPVPPSRVFALAASAVHPDTVYLATEEGMLRSQDGGKTWQTAHLLRRPATMIHTAPGGTLYAFMVGSGLLTAREPAMIWKTVSNGFGQGALMMLTVDPKDGNRLYAVTHEGRVVASRDGGVTWAPYGQP
jgi:photosystem II stability/assembly factor-like uncharacterized protein